MPLTANDVAFFAAQTMTDTTDGGGPRSSVQLQSTLVGQIFPPVAEADRNAGRVRLRKVYPSLMNSDTAPLLGASLAINEVPADAAVGVAIMAAASATETRAQAQARLHAAGEAIVRNVMVPAFTPLLEAAAGYTPGQSVLTFVSPDAVVPPVGAEIVVRTNVWRNLYRVTARTVPPDPAGRSITVNGLLPPGALVDEAAFVSWPDLTVDAGKLVRGALPVPGVTASGTAAVVLGTRYVRVTQHAAGAYAAGNQGIEPSFFVKTAGRLPAAFAGDPCTLWHEAETSPASQANGSTVNVGRDNLDQAAVVDANGVEVVRFLRSGPSTGAALTANLDTGVITFVNVAGLVQPLRVRHRIAHRSAIESISGVTVTLQAPTTREFPANSVLSTHLPLGDVQARALNLFGQQAWTRVWADSLIGNPAPLPYVGTVAVSNRGAESDRYAIVMKTGTTFDAFSERLGLLGGGTTTSTFAPVNPATGAPLFSLASSGWAAQQLVGSVLRFNTEGAAPPAWVLQAIAPSSPAGSTSTALRLFGSV